LIELVEERVGVQGVDVRVPTSPFVPGVVWLWKHVGQYRLEHDADAIPASISPFFIVKDLQVSISYYVGRFGFHLDFQGPDDGPYYAGVSRRFLFATVSFARFAAASV
jgi:hypothetical protein